MQRTRLGSNGVGLFAMLSILALSPALATAKPDRDLSVLTWNLYVGVNFSDARKAARSIWTMPQAIDKLFGQIAENDFEVRVKAFAKEVARRKPDVICLQEVALWRRAAGRTFDPTDMGTPIVEQDFLVIILNELRRQGLSYRLAVAGKNEDVRVPSFRYGKIRITDRNAILVSDRIEVEGSEANWFRAQREVRYLTFRFAFQRGWVSADLRLGKRRFKVLNVHLDLAWKTKKAQAAEALAMANLSDLPVVLAGDFNLNPDRLAWLRRAFRKAGLRDSWRVAGKGFGGTCCQAKPLTRPSRLPARVDLVLASRKHFRVRSTLRVGAGKAARVRFPDGKRRWISDHAGVITKLVFCKRIP